MVHFIGEEGGNNRTLIGRGRRLRTEPFRFLLRPHTFSQMASTMLQRQLCSRSPRLFQRSLSSTSAVRQLSPAQQTAQTTAEKGVFDTHIVEDLQGIHASEILAETGSRKEAKIRHFTGMSSRPRNHDGVLTRLLHSELWVRKIGPANGL